jgi:CDGSH-type Zn-finger protein
MDGIIFGEFKGTGNMEIHLDRKLTDKRVFPSIDVQAARARGLLIPKEDLNASGAPQGAQPAVASRGDGTADRQDVGAKRTPTSQLDAEEQLAPGTPRRTKDTEGMATIKVNRTAVSRGRDDVTLVDWNGATCDRQAPVRCAAAVAPTKPFCDGTHSRVSFAAAEAAVPPVTIKPAQ